MLAQVVGRTTSSASEALRAVYTAITLGTLDRTPRTIAITSAAPGEGKLSNESPVGKAIMGHKKGEVVEVVAPRGALKFKILEIKAA